MHEEMAHLNGGETAVAPKLRIVPREHTPLGDQPTMKELAHSIDSMGLNIHHNFQAVEQEIDDLRATVHVVNRNAAEGLATGRRVESILTDLVQAVRAVSDRLGSIEACVDSQDAPARAPT